MDMSVEALALVKPGTRYKNNTVSTFLIFLLAPLSLDQRMIIIAEEPLLVDLIEIYTRRIFQTIRSHGVSASIPQSLSVIQGQETYAKTHEAIRFLRYYISAVELLNIEIIARIASFADLCMSFSGDMSDPPCEHLYYQPFSQKIAIVEIASETEKDALRLHFDTKTARNFTGLVSRNQGWRTRCLSPASNYIRPYLQSSTRELILSHTPSSLRRYMNLTLRYMTLTLPRNRTLRYRSIRYYSLSDIHMPYTRRTYRNAPRLARFAFEP